METIVDLTKYPNNLEGRRASRQKILTPEARSANTHVLRVVSPETAAVAAPQHEAEKFQQDPFGYLRSVTLMCIGEDGLFEQLAANFNFVPASYVCITQDTSVSAYFLVEDLVHTRPNGFFLKDHNYYSPSVQTPTVRELYVRLFDRLYGGLLGYVLTSWDRDTPVLWDLLWRNQYFYDRERDELLFFDFDPFICYPKHDPYYYAARVGSLFKNIVGDITFLSETSRSEHPFPLIGAHIPELVRISGELRDAIGGNEILLMFYDRLVRLRL